MFLEVFDSRLRQHPAVPYQHNTRQPELLAQLVYLIGDRGGVSRVSRVHLHAHGAPVAVGQYAVDDDEPALLAVTVVSAPRQRAGAALVVAAADVVEHLVAFTQMPTGELLLDPGLPFQKPIHRFIEFARVGVLDRQFLGQRRRVP